MSTAEAEPIEEPVEEPTEEPAEPVEDPTEEPEPTKEPDPVEEPTEEPEPEPAAEGRCEATTSAGGTPYRCALDAEHAGEHSFQPVEASDTGDEEGASMEALQKSMKRVEGFRDRYVKVLAEEMGPEFENMTPCPLCPEVTPGFFFPGSIQFMGDEQRIAVRLAIGDAEIPSYSEDTHRKVCETCDGWGRVLTGSKRAQQDVLDCLDCGGKGYRSDQAAREIAQRQPEGEIVSGPWLEAPEAAVETAPDTDPWGTPPGAPYYGVLLNLRPDGWEAEVAQWKAANGF